MVGGLSVLRPRSYISLGDWGAARVTTANTVNITHVGFGDTSVTYHRAPTPHSPDSTQTRRHQSWPHSLNISGCGTTQPSISSKVLQICSWLVLARGSKGADPTLRPVRNAQTGLARGSPIFKSMCRSDRARVGRSTARTGPGQS